MGRDGYIGIRDAWPAVEALSLYNGGPTPDQGLFWPVQCLTSTGAYISRLDQEVITDRHIGRRIQADSGEANIQTGSR